jgi:DNA-directed RNA polymerase subunit M/transcription elongation factor TFIIS
MEFCKNCENMLYLRVENNDTLTRYCKNCNYSESKSYATDSEVIIDNDLKDEMVIYSQYMTKNIVYDPTLPRVNNIVCTNSSCCKGKDKDNKVIYIKYDSKNMKYLYFCTYCEHFWTET